MPAMKFPQMKRFFLAWKNVDTGCDLEDDLANRLLIHSVSDDTARVYLPELRAFLVIVLEKQVDFVSPKQLDRLLAHRLSALCYREKSGRQRGAKLLWGILWAFPEFRTHMFLSVRALKSWERIVPGGEGDPSVKKASTSP